MTYQGLNIFIYFSTYIIIWGFLYLLNIVPFNPIIWVFLILCISIIITIYIVYKKAPINKILLYLLLNSPKLILILLLYYNYKKNNINLLPSFIIGFIALIIYIFLLYLNNESMYTIYYNRTIEKILNNTF